MKQFQMDGYVCGSVETRSTNSGKQITTFGVNSPERRKNQQTGEWESVPQFFDMQYWHKGDRDFRAPSITDKAHLVLVGEPRYESWTNKEGQKRSKVVFNVSDLWPVERAGSSSPSYSAQEPEYHEAELLPYDCPF